MRRIRVFIFLFIFSGIYRDRWFDLFREFSENHRASLENLGRVNFRTVLADGDFSREIAWIFFLLFFVLIQIGGSIYFENFREITALRLKTFRVFRNL